MKDNVSIDLHPAAADFDVVEQFRVLFPEFEWHQDGVSVQGQRLTGKDTQGVKIQVWHEQVPVTVIVSYYDAWPHHGDRELRKLASIAEVQRRFGESFRLARVVM